jgi:hypothetical protein
MTNTQNALPQNSLGAIRTVAKLSAKDFRDFKLFLNIIKLDFNDFSLVGGAFRAYSNDRKAIVETGFGFFSDMHFDIPNIKNFLKVISTLDKKTTITVKADDTGVTIRDYLGEVRFRAPAPQLIDNKFVSDKDMEETVLNNIESNRLVVNEGISKKSVCRIKKVSRNLSPDYIYFKHEKTDLDRGFLFILGKKADSPEFSVLLRKPLLIPMKINHYFNLEILPCLFNEDDMYLKCYFTHDEKISTIYSTKVNDLFVNMYSQSELLKENEVG